MGDKLRGGLSLLSLSTSAALENLNILRSAWLIYSIIKELITYTKENHTMTSADAAVPHFFWCVSAVAGNGLGVFLIAPWTQ